MTATLTAARADPAAAEGCSRAELGRDFGSLLSANTADTDWELVCLLSSTKLLQLEELGTGTASLLRLLMQFEEAAWRALFGRRAEPLLAVVPTSPLQALGLPLRGADCGRFADPYTF